MVLSYDFAINITITVVKTTLPNRANMPVCMTLVNECDADDPMVPIRLSLARVVILVVASFPLSALGTARSLSTSLVHCPVTCVCRSPLQSLGKT